MSYNGFDNVSCRSGITSRNSAPGGSEAAGSEMDASGQGPRQRRPVKYQTPQEVIDEFWTKFTTKTPGKATRVIPQNEYADRVAKKNAKTSSSSITTQSSYEDATAMCRAKVDKIVRECRRINKKYRDPHFDLETDLKLGGRDCLQSLANVQTAEPPGSDFKPRSAKRVTEIFDNPCFYIEGPTANDVRQGRDGDCWLMAALCTLSNKKGLIERLCVAHDQAVGVYGFVFYRDGEWISEIVDDFLYLTKSDYDESFQERMLFNELERTNPEEAYRKIYQSNSAALYFAQCQNPQETWLPLLEKAYAKAHGDYASIEGGFGGEGIEDLTGGVTSEIFTTDILDKEYFWNEELLKVNKDFLFGCSTGVWGRNWGERKGIVELHAYSIQKAVEIDGKRLLRLKNPWGKGEWNGPWSDGSKEWTPEWLQKLGHRFGDDGDFWIAYEDLLRKYQAFERTRLFENDWRISQIWTTVSVPWMLDYHDTHFSLKISRPGPVVIVLAQPDDRYFRGLEGQYRFELALRLHKAGHEDYLVRSQTPYRMRRSVNVELELEEGEYDVRVKIDAARWEDVLPIEQVIRNSAKDRREKLIRVGLAYDLAHSKGKIVETAEEKKALDERQKRLKNKELKEIKEKLLKHRKEAYYLKMKQFQRDQQKALKTKEKKKAKIAERKAKRAKAESDKVANVELDKKPLDSDDIVGESGEKESDESKNTTPTSEVEGSSNETPDSTHSNEGQSTQVSGNNPPQQDQEVADDQKTGGNDADQGFCESEEDDEDDASSFASLSELSERELDLQAESYCGQATGHPTMQRPLVYEDELDEFEKDPWNAVTVIGLRVYHKIADDDKDKDIIKLSVIRPNPYADEDDSDDGEKTETDGIDNQEKQNEMSKGLDVDDSAKDATLEGGVKDRKKSIMGTTKRAG